MHKFEVSFWKDGVVINQSNVIASSFIGALLEAEGRLLFSACDGLCDSVSISLSLPGISHLPSQKFNSLLIMEGYLEIYD